MSKVRIDAFVDAEDALQRAAAELIQIKSTSSLLSGNQEQAAELVAACESLVTASETLRAKSEQAMAMMIEVDLKGSLEEMRASLKQYGNVLERENRETRKEMRGRFEQNEQRFMSLEQRMRKQHLIVILLGIGLAVSLGVLMFVR